VSPPKEPPAGETPAGETPAAETTAAETTAAERATRQEILKNIPEWKRTVFNIPIRHLTAQEWMEQLRLAQAKEKFVEGNLLLSARLMASPSQPYPRTHWIRSASR
jgi:hypothetical protein